MGNNIESKLTLQCPKCEGTVLAEWAIRLRNGVSVLRYICINCGRRWHGVETARQSVLVEAKNPILTATPAKIAALPVDDDGESVGIAA